MEAVFHPIAQIDTDQVVLPSHDKPGQAVLFLYGRSLIDEVATNFHSHAIAGGRLCVEVGCGLGGSARFTSIPFMVILARYNESRAKALPLLSRNQLSKKSAIHKQRLFGTASCFVSPPVNGRLSFHLAPPSLLLVGQFQHQNQSVWLMPATIL